MGTTSRDTAGNLSLEFPAEDSPYQRRSPEPGLHTDTGLLLLRRLQGPSLPWVSEGDSICSWGGWAASSVSTAGPFLSHPLDTQVLQTEACSCGGCSQAGQRGDTPSPLGLEGQYVLWGKPPSSSGSLTQPHICHLQSQDTWSLPNPRQLLEGVSV